MSSLPSQTCSCWTSPPVDWYVKVDTEIVCVCARGNHLYIRLNTAQKLNRILLSENLENTDIFNVFITQIALGYSPQWTSKQLIDQPYVTHGRRIMCRTRQRQSTLWSSCARSWTSGNATIHHRVCFALKRSHALNLSAVVLAHFSTRYQLFYLLREVLTQQAAGIYTNVADVVFTIAHIPYVFIFRYPNWAACQDG